MVRDEGVGGSAPGYHASHRSLDFEETEFIEETTDVVDDLATDDEDPASLI